jgi:Flp pilus assembly protein TadD
MNFHPWASELARALPTAARPRSLTHGQSSLIMKTKCLLTTAAVIAAFLLLASLATAQTPAASGSTASATPAPASPADAATLHQQGLESFKQKDYKAAVDLAEKATKADPTNPEYFSQLGIAISQRMNEVNFMQMAIMSSRLRKAFEKCVELDPNHVGGLIGLSRYYSNAPEIAGGSLEKAKEFALRVQKIIPLQGEIELGHIAAKAEDYAEALHHYEAAIALKPDNAGLHNAAGQMLAKLGRKPEARAHFETALKLKPDFEAVKKALVELDAPAS